MSTTLRALLMEAIPELERSGVETPRLDAELLLAHLLHRNRAFLYAHLDDAADAGLSASFRALICRRAGREPLPYLLGYWEFMGLRFRVTPAVLIPRPETEELLEAVVRRVPPNATILDVGAGSGCISVALAKQLPQSTILAMEPSESARAVAAENIAAHNVGDRVRLLSGYFPDAARYLPPLDALVSNPPYIPSAEVDALAPELRRFEPRLALDGGPDGLDVLRPLAETGPSLVRPGGWIAMEVGAEQANQVLGLLGSAPHWHPPSVKPDLAGIPRVVLAQRRD